MRTIYILFIYLFISCSDKTHLADRCIKNQIFSENYDSISVDIRYIGYACSECPQYNIEKVYYSENKEEYFYFNKEIYMNILDKELQNQIDTIKYPTHWKYRVNGLFSRNGFGMGKLDIYTGKILKLNLEK